MPNQINSILWKLRENKKTLNIITEFYDEKTLFDLSKTNHNFFILPKNNQNGWNNFFRKKPDNISVLKNYEECFFSLSEYAFDVFLSFTGKWDYLSLHFGIPKIKPLKTIGIDEDLFLPNEIKSEVFLYVNGSSKINLEDVRYITKGLNFVGLDDNNRRKFEDLLNLYKSSMVYINFSKRNKISQSMLEAMSCACCPLAFDSEENRKIIKHGENGFLFNTKEEARVICEKLLVSKDFLKSICNNARKTIVEKFSFSSFINEWNDHINNSLNLKWWETI